MRDVRTYLLTAPRWAASMYSGLFFGICVAVVVLSMPGSTSWLAAAVSGAVIGGLFGALMTLTTGGQRRDLRAAAGDLPLTQLPDAYRAAVGGRFQ
jgi:membrane associated rhomboid family serine protease